MERVVTGPGYYIEDGWLYPTSDEIEWLVKDGCPVLPLKIIRTVGGAIYERVPDRRKIARRKIYNRYIFCPDCKLFYITNKSGGVFYC